jgi:hypothetical protein
MPRYDKELANCPYCHRPITDDQEVCDACDYDGTFEDSGEWDADWHDALYGDSPEDKPTSHATLSDIFPKS